MEHLMVPVVTGCLAILVGLAPAGKLIGDLIDGVERFRAAVLGLPPGLPRRAINQNLSGRLKGQIWFAVGGAALIVVSILNYAFR